MKLAPLLWAGALSVAGSWARLDEGYKGLLLHPGVIAQKQGRPYSQIVLLTTRYVVLSARATVTRGDDALQYVNFTQPMSENMCVDVIDDLTEWSCKSLDALSPNSGATKSARTSLKLIQGREHSSLLESAARRGFRGLLRPDLIRLYDTLEQDGVIEAKPGPRPTTVVKLVLRLIQHIFPEASQEEASAMATARADDGTEHDSKFIDLDALPADDNDLDDEVDDDEMQQQDISQREKFRKSQKAQDDARRELKAALARELQIPPAREPLADVARPSAAAAPPAAAGPRPIPWTPRGFTQRQAKEFLPEGCKIRKDCTRAQRWQVHGADFLVVRHSRTWSSGAPGGFSDNDALGFVLFLAWQDYTRQFGGECPWLLDVPLAAAN